MRDSEWRNGARLELLSAEQTGQEVTWSHGRALDAAEVQKAFALPADKMPVLQRDVASGSGGSGLLVKIVVGLLLLAILFALLRACSRDDCQDYKDTYGASSAEYQQCKRNAGSGVIYSGSGGGSYGGYSSGGGGHK